MAFFFGFVFVFLIDFSFVDLDAFVTELVDLDWLVLEAFDPFVEVSDLEPFIAVDDGSFEFLEFPFVLACCASSAARLAINSCLLEQPVFCRIPLTIRDGFASIEARALADERDEAEAREAGTGT